MPSSPYCNRKPLLAIVGPTGAGKTDLALRIAEHLDGEIVNCDSMQIYRGFDIGTAKLPVGERREIPHHLLSFLDPKRIYSAGEYARDARQVILEIGKRSRLPILVGGTGFYLRALLDGLPDLPPRDAGLRQRLETRSSGSVYRLLQRLDGRAAQRLNPNDRMRVTRALEIRLISGKPSPEPRAGSALPEFAVRKLGLFPPRNELYSLIDQRTVRMFEVGLIEEVRTLLASGVPPSAKPFEAVGYRQALQFVEGKISLIEAVAETQRATRNYAKRQITWFRHENAVESLPRFGTDVDLASLGLLPLSPEWERNETVLLEHLTPRGPESL